MPSRPYRSLTMIFLVLVPICAVSTAQTTDQLLATFPSRPYPAGVFDFNKTIVIPRSALWCTAPTKSVAYPLPISPQSRVGPPDLCRGPIRLVQCSASPRPSPASSLRPKATAARSISIGTTGQVNPVFVQRLATSPLTVRPNCAPTLGAIRHGLRNPIRTARTARTELTDYVPKDRASRGERLEFFQIPGTAIVLKGGGGPQAGAYGIYDNQVTRLSDVLISQAINGIDDAVGDSRLDKIGIAGIVKDGLTISGSGTQVYDAHVSGADRAAVFKTAVIATDCYFEAARIGLDLRPAVTAVASMDSTSGLVRARSMAC